MPYNYSQDASEAHSSILEYGGSATLRKVLAPVYNPDGSTKTPASTANYSCTAVKFPYSEAIEAFVLDGVQEVTEVFYISNQIQSNQRPEVHDQIIYNNKNYEITILSTIEPHNTPVLYTAGAKQI